MAKGRLESPNLDDRSWQDIVNQVTGLIPHFNPEWTDHNRSDLGITLVELFAWLVEGMIYRLNRVPDKNFIEFLNLVGVARDPQTPATVMLSYRLGAPTPPGVLPKGSQVATQQTDAEPAIVFETDESVQLLPINLTHAVHVRAVGGAPQYANVTRKLAAAPLSGFQTSIPAGGLHDLVLGFDQASVGPVVLRVDLRKVALAGELTLQFTHSQVGTAPPASWALIPVAQDGTAQLTRDGLVSLTVPASWGAQAPSAWLGVVPETPGDQLTQPLFWLGMRIRNNLGSPYALDIASILFNAVHATSALTVTQPEVLGTSDGKPFQVFALKNVPLYETPGVPDRYRHLVIQVREPLLGGTFTPWNAWSRVDDFPQGGGTVYRLQPVTGEIDFGNHDPLSAPKGHGTIPALGSEIRALTYRYVAGGVKANVPSATITVIRTPTANVVAATNPGAAENGADEESVDDTKRRGPEALRNRYRAVSAQDYEYLVGEASTEVRKVRCLGPRHFTTYDKSFDAAVVPGDPWTYGQLNRDRGNVHVLIIPGGPLSDATPAPSAELLREVSDYLEERRTVTTALNVTNPRYIPIRVTAQIRVWQKAVDTGLVPDPGGSTQVRDTIAAKITQFLHPVLGNVDGKGWQIGEDQTIAPLFEFIKPDAEVGFISDLKIEALTPLYTPALRLFPIGAAGAWVKLADYEMVCSAPTHNVTVTKS